MAKSAIPIPILSENDKNRFFKKISIIPTANGCIEWKACKSSQGYGNFKIEGKVFKSHRIAYFIHTKKDPADLCVCHHCDNPACCNPEHFFLGTYTDNNRDKETKGRSNHPKGDNHPARLRPETRPRGDRHGSKTKPESVIRGEAHYFRRNPEKRRHGENHGRSKLKDSDIPKIRADTRTQKLIAKDYGVDRSIISAIKLNKIWTHVP